MDSLTKKMFAWEKRNTKRANKLARALNRLLKTAPKGVITPSALYKLYDELEEWGIK